MAFSSSFAGGGSGRPSPPNRGSRQLGNGGIAPRDKVSRMGFMSILLVIYSAITLGLILWNSQSSGGTNPTVSDEAPGRLPNESRVKLGGNTNGATAIYGVGGVSDKSGMTDQQPLGGVGAPGNGVGGGAAGLWPGGSAPKEDALRDGGGDGNGADIVHPGQDDVGL